MAGWREVIAIIPAKEGSTRRGKPVTFSRSVETGKTRLVAVWPKGRPLDWRLEAKPVLRREPAWYGRARELRRRGMSFRRIAAEVGKSPPRVRQVLEQVPTLWHKPRAT